MLAVATFITKNDLFKGPVRQGNLPVWQVPLTNRTKENASFVAIDAVYQCQSSLMT